MQTSDFFAYLKKESVLIIIYNPTTGQWLAMAYEPGLLLNFLNVNSGKMSLKNLEAAIHSEEFIKELVDQVDSDKQASANVGSGGGGPSGGYGSNRGGGSDTLTFPSGCGCSSWTGPNESTGIMLAPVIVTDKHFK